MKNKSKNTKRQTTMPDLFKETVPSILKTKMNVYKNDDEARDYVPFVVNRALSYHIDCLMHVAELNRQAFTIPKKYQYEYLLNAIVSKSRRFVKWEKPIKHEDVDLIKEYYKCSLSKAFEALSILNEKEVQRIREYLGNKGGLNNNSSNNKGEKDRE